MASVRLTGAGILTILRIIRKTKRACSCFLLARAGRASSPDRLKENDLSRYTGPRLKVMRALGTELPGLSRKPLGERNYPPGQHGQRPKRKSGFGVQLIEKQKLRFNYGLGERQIQRLFREAKRDRGPTGDKLLELLERRLDNFVFRAGFAPTTVAASKTSWAGKSVGSMAVTLARREANFISPIMFRLLLEEGPSVPSATRTPWAFMPA